MSKLKFDYNFVMKENLLSGITDNELKAYKEKVTKGLTRLNSMVNDGSVGFPKLPYQNLEQIKNYSRDIKGQYNDLIIIGIGGSILGIESVINSLLPYGYNAMNFTERGFMPRVWIADNIDSSKVYSTLNRCKQEDTLIVVISKSGSTLETVANFSIIYNWLKSSVTDISKHIVVITDPEKGSLKEISKKFDYQLFVIPPSVGGRYSVLSPVGLLPMAIFGVNIDNILLGAKHIIEDGTDSIITAAAIYLYFMEQGKSINILMPYSSRLEKFSEWFCQLWGESLGKKLTFDSQPITFGTTPVRALGAVDQHSQLQLYKESKKDKVITFIGIDTHKNNMTVKSEFPDYFSYLSDITLGKLLNVELSATEAVLLQSDIPSLSLTLSIIDEYSLGQLFMFYQYVVSVIGLTVNINPFDQPSVEEAKDFIYGIINRKGFEGKKEEFNNIYKKDDKYII